MLQSARRAGKRNGLRGFVHLADSEARHGPDLKRQHFDVAQVMPVAAYVAGPELKTVESLPRRFGRWGQPVRDLVVALPRKSRTVPPPAVDEELREMPTARGGFRDAQAPPALTVYRPAAKPNPAADYRNLLGVWLIHHRRPRHARVLGRKPQRRIQEIRPPADLHHDLAAPVRDRALKLPDRFLRPRHRGERPVRSRTVRSRQPPGPRIPPIRRNVKPGSIRAAFRCR